MDFFDKQLKKAFSKSVCVFSIEDCKLIFEMYFDLYKYYTGHEHPPIKTEKLIAMLDNIDGDGLFDAECYPELIRSYFETPFRNCDRNICHFMSGKIRELRFYETCY